MSKNTKNSTGIKDEQKLGQIRQLQKELNDAHEGLRELSRALDGIVAQMAVRYGSKTDRGYEVRLTPVPPDEMPYTLETRREQGEYIICALPKSERKDETCIGQDLQSKN